MKHVFIAVPTYDQQVALRHEQSILAGVAYASQHDVMCSLHGAHTSLLARCFNSLWCQALNMKPRPDYFLMLHADIAPLHGDWIVKMVKEMQRTGCQILSAISPQKTADGYTSTAIGDAIQPWNERDILTLRQCFDLPETFGLEDVTTEPDKVLLVNTGCMLVDMAWQGLYDFTKGPLYFHIDDVVGKRADGTYEFHTLSEDWNFSTEAAVRGAKVLATRKIHLYHHGASVYTNERPWGAEKPTGPLVRTETMGQLSPDEAA